MSSLVSKVICDYKQKFICDNCGREYEVTINKDFYINITDGSVRHKCPLCGAEYKLSFDYEMVKDKK